MKRIVMLLASIGCLGFIVHAQNFTYSGNWGKAGYNIVESTPASIQLVYSVPSFSLSDVDVNGQMMKDISLPGNLLFNDAGAPNIPSAGRYIAIPQGSVPVVRILSQQTEVIENVEIAPAPVIPLGNDDNPLQYTKNESIYARNDFFPQSPVILSEPFRLRGVDAVIIGTSPFQYNPVTKQLIVYKDLRIEIAFEGGNGQFGNTLYRNRWWDPILADMLLNYATLPSVNYDERLQTYSPQSRSEECEYIIITPTGPDFLAWADTIRRFRSQQGILTHVFTLDEIGGNTTTAIEDFIDNAYNNWTIKPVACLLLGDYGSDATKNIISPLLPHPAGYPDFACDNKYADVTGDKLPDVVFARITANNATQLQVMCSKFLDNERTPVTDPLFYSKPITAIGWQTERWFQLCGEIIGGYFKNVKGKTPRRINDIYQGSPGSTWSTAANTNTIVNYFGPNGLGYIPQSPSTLGGWTGGNALKINNAVDSGAFFILHRDHGEYSGWGEPSYHIGDITNLNNTALTFVFSINCQTGAYQRSSECFGEKFHRHTKNSHNAGALGIVCPSEVSYSFVNDTFVWGMFDNMWDDFMPAEIPNPPSRGALPAFGHAAGKYFLKQSSWPSNPGDKNVTFNLFHMHGDAFLTLYYEVPQQLTVIHDETIQEGSTVFNISANQDALIALTVNDSIIATATGQGSTPIVMTIPGMTAGTQVLVTVTLQNYFRYSDVVPVVGNTLMADFSSSATQICTGSSVDFTDLSGGTPSTWEWTFEGGTPSSSTDQNPANITYSAPGDYTVTLTVTKDSDTNTMVKASYIHVYPYPVADFENTTVCVGSETSFTDLSDPNGGTVSGWSWDFGDPASGINNTSTLQNPTHTFSSAGTFQVTLSVLNNGTCPDGIIKDVVVLDIPGVAETPEGNTEICQASTGNALNTAGALYAQSYTWEVNPVEAGVINGTTESATFDASATYSGQAAIKVKGINSCGEGPYSGEFSFQINPLPSVAQQPTGADSVNLNKIDESVFSTAGSQNADSYAWSLDPAGAGTIDGAGTTGTVTWDKSYRGDAFVTVKGINACGEGTASDQKQVYLYAPVGISDQDGLGIDVYPNPNAGKFSVVIRSASAATVGIRVLNSLGMPVFTETGVKIDSRFTKTIDLGNISDGIYYLKIEGSQGTLVRKIVVRD
jgi:PKD repeat protein